MAAKNDSTKTKTLMQDVNRIIALEEANDDHQEVLDLIQNAVTWEIAKNPTNEEQIRNVYNPRIDHFKKKIKDNVSQYCHKCSHHHLLFVKKLD